MEKLILKSGREKSAINKHPWLFSGGVKQFPKAKLGDIVKIIDNKEAFVAYGFYDANSQIVSKLFHFSEVEHDEFKPQFWKDKIVNAFELRKKIIDFKTTNTYRLLHAEGDFFPGLVADVYDKTVVLQISNKGVERLISIITETLKELGFEYIYKKIKSHHIDNEQDVSKDEWITSKPNIYPILVKEHDIKFVIDVEKGQKTGFFIDQRENRKLLQSMSKGKTVLNTFSYSGGFSAYSLAGNAKKVVSVDISKDAIELAHQNINLNNNFQNHEAIVADCFEYLKKEKSLFDIIVLDPPAFAKTPKAVANATRGYKELNMLGMKLAKKGGFIFTFSCSQNIDKILFQKIVFGAAADVGRNVRIVQHLEQPADHPVNIFHPEGEYLKGLLLYIE